MKVGDGKMATMRRRKRLFRSDVDIITRKGNNLIVEGDIVAGDGGHGPGGGHGSDLTIWIDPGQTLIIKGSLSAGQNGLLAGDNGGKVYVRVRLPENVCLCDKFACRECNP